MKAVQLLMCPLIACCVGFYIDHCNQPLTWDEANVCCKSHGLVLPVVRTSTDVHVVSGLANVNDMVTVWVSLRKRRFLRWSWLDGTSGWPNATVADSFGDCAMYLPKTGELLASQCNDLTNGLLCEIRDCSDCKCDKWLPTCVLHNNKSYVYLCDELTWHQARSYCALEGWRLAVFPDSTIRGSARNIYCDKFWIGLRRKDWEQPYDAYYGSGEVYTLWDTHEPGESGHCSVLNRTTSGWKLRVQSCQLKTTFICTTESTSIERDQNMFTTEQPYTAHAASEITPNLGGKQKSMGLSTQTIVIWVVGSILAVAFLITVCAVAFLLIKRADKPGTSDGTDTGLLEKKKTRLQERLSSHMIERYSKINLRSWLDDQVSSEHMNDLYTDLVWTNRPDLGKTDIIREYTDMFKLSGQHRQWTNVFLAGDAGTGKSTFTRKIATDWCNLVDKNPEYSKCVSLSTEGKSAMERFDFVLLLCLRHIEKKQCMQAAIKDQLGLNEKYATELEGLISDEQHNTLLIFDGYDEYTDSTSKDITDILHRKKLQHTSLLITSRYPRKFHYRNEKVSIGNEVCLVGFSQKSTDLFIEKFFKGKTTGDELKLKIKQSKYLVHLSQIPAVLLIIAILWRDNKNISHTITGFYRDVVKYQCDKYMKPKKRTESDSIQKYRDSLMKIGKIAVSGLTEDGLELSFPYKNVIASLGQEAWALGFLTRRPGTKNVATFPHETLQEYFLAYYIVHVDTAEQRELLVKFWNSKKTVSISDMIPTFVLGLGGEELYERVQTIWKDDDDGSQQVDLQLNYLSQNQNVRPVLPSVVKLIIKPPVALYTKYLKSDTSSLTCLTLRVRLGTDYDETSSREIISSASGMQQSDGMVTQASQVIWPLFNTLTSCRSLTYLDISNTILSRPKDETEGFTALKDSCLTTLIMKRCGLVASDVRPLFDILPDSNLTDLNLSENIFSRLALRTEELSKLKDSQLTTLIISKCHLNANDIKTLLRALPSRLTHLDVSGNALDARMEEIISIAEQLSSLKRLNLQSSKFPAGVKEKIKNTQEVQT